MTKTRKAFCYRT